MKKEKNEESNVFNENRLEESVKPLNFAPNNEMIDLNAKNLAQPEVLRQSTLKSSTWFQNITKENNNNKLEFSFWEYLTMSGIHKKRRSKRHQLIRKAEQTFIEDLDVVNMITKLHDLDKLKVLLLNNFDYLSKPAITAEENDTSFEKQLSFSQRKMNYLINVGKNSEARLKQCYSAVLANKNDRISSKLLELFDEESYGFQDLGNK